MSLQEQFTLIIPSYNNRGYYLNRICDYYKDEKFKIIVIDSSENRQPIKTGAENLEYIHCPELNYFQKIKFALAKVSTPYAALCPDDDFTVPAAIQAGIDFLDQNEDYYSAGGNEVWFLKQKQIRFYPLKLETYNLDINNESSIERIANLKKNYTYLHYSVHRLKNLQDTFNIMGGLSGEHIRFGQNILDVVCLINGKHKVLPVFYGCKEISLTSASYHVRYDVLTDSQSLNQSFAEIVNHLAIKEQVNESDAKKSLRSFFDFDIQQPIEDLPLKSLLKIRLQRKINHVKLFVDNYMLLPLRNKKNIELAKQMDGYPFTAGSKENKELEKIKKIISNYI